MFLLVFPFLWLLESYSTTVYIVYVFEWVKAFHSNFDRLLVLLERLLEKRQPSAYGDELLRQGSGIPAESEPENLTGLS